MKWVSVITAPNEPIGESWAELLRGQGVPAFVQRDTVRAYLGSGITPVRIMVPEEREEDGKRVLDNFVGPDEWPPEETR